MNDVIILGDWPQPAVVSEPTVFADDTTVVLRYKTNDGTAIIKFPLADTFMFGAPNDEALGGHPLSKKGLKFYSVHRVDNSSWIEELERRNAVHPQHDRERFMKDKIHYVFTFQDSTFECVVNEGQFWKPEITVHTKEEDAELNWRKHIKAEQTNAPAASSATDSKR